MININSPSFTSNFPMHRCLNLVEAAEVESDSPLPGKVELLWLGLGVSSTLSCLLVLHRLCWALISNNHSRNTTSTDQAKNKISPSVE